LPVLDDAHPTRKSILCGTGILPVLENDAICEFPETGFFVQDYEISFVKIGSAGVEPAWGEL
jgi:hypothetical protein